MNVYSLPAKIREIVEPILNAGPAVSIARMRGSVGGGSGEGYIVALPDRVYLYSRSLGEYEYSQNELYYKGDIQLLDVRDERFGLILELTTRTGEKLEMKFAKYQEENLAPIIQQWRQATGAVATAPPPAAAARPAAGGGEPSPYVAALAVLIFIAAEDGEVDASEESYILRFSGGENEVFAAAHDYYEGHEYEDLMPVIGKLDRQQKMCVLTNAVDVAMADGVLHKCEQEMVNRLAGTMGISEQELDSMRDILLVKNQISVLIG